MSISTERIEAASEPMRRKYCRSTNCTASNCECRAMAAVSRHATETAAAEARGRVEGIRIAQKLMHAEKLVARVCCEAATVLALQSIHRDLEQRIAALQAEKEGA